MTKKYILGIITFVLTFFILDVLLNLKFPPKCSVYQFDPVLGHSLIPNKTCVEKTDEYNVEYKINSLGFRDREFTKEPPPQTFRILFLGDSFTQGYGISPNDTFVKRTEFMLNQNSDKHFETINAGVSAYTTLNDYLILKYKGLELKPNLVILNVNATDFIEQRSLLKKVQIKENGDASFASLQRKKYLPDSADRFLTDHSYIYNQFVKNQEGLVKLKGKIVAFVKRQKPPDYTKNSVDFIPGDPDSDVFAVTRNIPQDEFDSLVSPVLKQLDEVKKNLDHQNIPLVITFIPHGHQVAQNQWVEGRVDRKLTDDSYPDTLQSRLSDFAKLNGINFLDLTPYLKGFVKTNPYGKLYFDYDGHFNTLGQKIAAEGIYNYLLSAKTLSTNSPILPIELFPK